jgi:hypothetical protein
MLGVTETEVIDCKIKDGSFAVDLATCGQKSEGLGFLFDVFLGKDSDSTNFLKGELVDPVPQLCR